MKLAQDLFQGAGRKPRGAAATPANPAQDKNELQVEADASMRDAIAEQQSPLQEDDGRMVEGSAPTAAGAHPHQDTNRSKAASAKSSKGRAAAAPLPGQQQLPAMFQLQECQRCCDVLREALVDAGSSAAALVPLRPSLQRVQADLEQVLEEAVSSQNGNASLLVLGPAGSGKTLVVDRAISALCARHNPGADTAANRNVGVVRLNGLLQPDERSAFQEVAKQLCREFGEKFQKSASFEENLAFLKGMLHALYKCVKKVVFVLDELQQYARHRGKQQVLYYLLDLLQDSKIQAAVIGISSCYNVADDLEKRVMSRVGRRRVIIAFPVPKPDDMAAAAGPSTSRQATAGASPSGQQAGSSGVSGGGGSVSTAAPPADEQYDSYAGLMHDMLALHPGMEELAGLAARQGVAAQHNAALSTALADARVKAGLAKLEEIGAPPQHLALVAETALAAWGTALRGGGGASNRASDGNAWLTAAYLLQGLAPITEWPDRAMADSIGNLSVAQLVLLVAAHRLQKKGQAMCNFEMAWDEYRAIQAGRSAVEFSKPAAEAAWHGLGVSGLAHYVDANVESRGKDLAYAGLVLLVNGTEVEQGVQRHPHCPDVVRRFYLQEV